MSDLVCSSCQQSCSVLPQLFGFKCGHFFCAQCCTGNVCRVDQSYTVQNDQNVDQLLGQVTAAANEASSVQSSNWDAYYQSIHQLRTYLAQTYTLQCHLGHTHEPQGCWTCYANQERVEDRQQSCGADAPVQASTSPVPPNTSLSPPSSLWQCTSCPYKYNSPVLQLCANCHYPR